jgi:hypothetical protein
MNPSLTTPQLQTLRGAITADALLNNQPQSDDGDQAIADAMNLAAAPAFTVWRTRVLLMEVTAKPGFDWTRVDNLSVGKARIWEWMFMPGSICSPALASVRAGVEAAFSVAGTDAPCRQAFYDAGSRLSTRVERLYTVPATVPGGGTTGSNGNVPNANGVGPQNITTEGPLTSGEVRAARNLP